MNPGDRDPYDAIVYHPPSPPVDSKIQQQYKMREIFHEETPGRGRQEDPRLRAQVSRDEVCGLDERGGHRWAGLHCPHGLYSSPEHIAGVEEAERDALTPTPPIAGKDWTVQGTDFGRGTR